MAIPSKEQIKSMFSNPEMSSFITEKIRDMYHKIVENEQEDKLFSVNLRKLLNGDNMVASHPLAVGKTPNALAICGAKDNLDIQITKSVIDKCMRPEINVTNGIYPPKNGHSLTEEQLSNALSELKEPVMILKGSQENFLVAVTDLHDDKERPIIVAVRLNHAKNNGVVNSVSSAYGKKEFAQYLQRNFEEGNILAINKEKANELFLSIGAQLPVAATVISFDNIISYSKENVKYPEQEKSKNFDFTDSIKELTVTEINGHSASALFDVPMSDEGKKNIYERADIPDKPSSEDVFKSKMPLDVFLEVHGNGGIVMEIVLQDGEDFAGTSILLTDEEQKKLFELADSAFEKDGGVKSAIKKEVDKIKNITDD